MVTPSARTPADPSWVTKACARCGRSFACGANTDSCWCDAVTLTDAQRTALSALRLTGCLCPDCLEGLPPGPGDEDARAAPTR
jgi:hypothetical protein